MGLRMTPRQGSALAEQSPYSARPPFAALASFVRYWQGGMLGRPGALAHCGLPTRWKRLGRSEYRPVSCKRLVLAVDRKSVV